MAGYLVYAIVLFVLIAIGLLVAAFLDRRRGREIERDLQREPHRHFAKGSRTQRRRS